MTAASPHIVRYPLWLNRRAYATCACHWMHLVSTVERPAVAS